MQCGNNKGHPVERRASANHPARLSFRLRILRPACALFITLAVLAVAAQTGRQPSPDKPVSAPSTQAGAAANSQPPDVERRKQIAADSASLLKLATDLKAEVDKTNKDVLSIKVIRTAEEIERLTRTMKEKTKPTVEAR